MKKLASIPSFLLSTRDVANLRLQNQAFMLIIPKKLLTAAGYMAAELSFDLVIENGRVSLLGHDKTRETRNATLEEVSD